METIYKGYTIIEAGGVVEVEGFGTYDSVKDAKQAVDEWVESDGEE